mgnify:CR=1 FL=1
MRIGAIEAGGTKFVCGIGDERGTVLERISFPTGAPGETIERAAAFFRGKAVDAIGIASFGPVDLDPRSATYGYVTTTPKPGWANFDFLGAMKREFDVPFGWDTDVNAAALGEASWGAAKGLDSCVYYTIGTGIGAGVFAEGKLVHGLVHPEAGHMILRRHPDDRFAGNCPYHGDCLEGLAAGPAIEKRWGIKGAELPPDHPAWTLEAHYIAQAVVNTIFLLSPKRIILGGGVMKQEHLFPLIRGEVRRMLAGYVRSAAVEEGAVDDYIVPPGLGDNAGLCGAIALGLDAWRRASAQ